MTEKGTRTGEGDEGDHFATGAQRGVDTDWFN